MPAQLHYGEYVELTVPEVIQHLNQLRQAVTGGEASVQASACSAYTMAGFALHTTLGHPDGQVLASAESTQKLTAAQRAEVEEFLQAAEHPAVRAETAGFDWVSLFLPMIVEFIRKRWFSGG